ncbi:MAG: RbsD/FucU domain-containing protein [Pseudomonadota bacterium]|nr:RbsD/FucU domain-containing protein [Pseudomonadota bacterium]
MLKEINPLLNAKVLHALAAMGHGDDLIVADANFPAQSIARDTILGSLLRTDGVSAADAVAALLSVMPLDSFVEDAAARMKIVGAADEIPPVQAKIQASINAAEFHARRFYGYFAFTKGVIPPEA